MTRHRFSILAGLLCVLTGMACSENPNDVKRLVGFRGTVVTSTQSLDQRIRELLALFPKNLDQRDGEFEGEELNPRATWDQITKKYATGQTKPAHLVIAKRKLVRLSDWVTKNAQLMNPPTAPETKDAAAARLVLYMNMYVYGGPGGTPPDFLPGADVAVGIVTPGAPATIVTPTKHAGVQFEAGSVDENTVVVVIQNPTVFSANCSGPLDTKFCQYPQFYTFDQFPHKTLLKPAKFNVCHVTGEGGARNPGALHNRLRLAHTKPAISTDYTPGSTIRDNIEILPLVPQTFSTCEASSYEIGLGDAGLISRFARGIRKIVSPKTAYAIDLGLGGLSKSFSAFNDVDSVGRPDIAVQSFDVPAGPVPAGNHFTVAYSVTNIGKATNAAVPFAIRLRFPIAGGLFSSVEIGGGTLPSLVPGATYGQVNVDAVIPATLPSGSYTVRFIVASDPTFPDANFANNEFEATVTVDPSVVSLPRTLSVGGYSVCALTASSVGYCWGSNDRREFGTATLSPLLSSSPFPAPIPAFASLSGGNSQHMCGITSTGSAMCWGRADFGVLGDGTAFGNVSGSAPVTVAGGFLWKTITVSRLSTCGVSTGFLGYCWGNNQRGEIGSASIPVGSSATSFPNLLDGGHAWQSVVTGWLHACGITTAGVAYCWGDNAAGQLGIGTTDNVLGHNRVPTAVATTERFIQLSLGTRSTCGITTKHEAFCWGENGTGQIGDGTTAFKTAPTPVAGGHIFSYIAVSTGFAEGSAATPPQPGGNGNVGHTCALTESGTPYCWGWNGNGQLGDGSTTDHLTPQPVAGGLSLTSIALGGSSTCGRLGNQIWCWGSNLLGQLGNGNQVNSLTPSLVSSPFGGP
jgi:alpha-tubulin suppressor-like RCC1 family protein